MIDVRGDLLGSAPCSDVLGAGELVAAAVARHAQQVAGHKWYRSAGTFLPRRVSGGIHDDLANDSPALVVRVASRDEEAGECVGNAVGSGLGRVTVQVSKGGAHASPVVNRPRELRRASSRPSC